jgi:sugar lactone lactonase YvrE
MKKTLKKRVLSLSLALTFMVGIMLNFPINANAATYSSANILLGSTYNQVIGVILDNTGQGIYASEYGGGNITKTDKATGSSTLIKSGLNQPIGMALDSNDDLYVALHGGRKVIKIDHSTGAVSDVATVGFGLLTGIVLDSSKQHLYVADYSAGKIIKMNKDGTNKSDFATGLTANSIIGMTIDSSDNLYVSDRTNSSVMKIDTSATVTTICHRGIKY